MDFVLPTGFAYLKILMHQSGISLPFLFYIQAFLFLREKVDLNPNHRLFSLFGKPES